jgi:hypothetical protein
MSHNKEPPSARFDFPIMLYGMLEDCTFDENLSRIVSWQPHGLSFKVHDRDGMERIIHRWFKEKYESFRCLLEQWGFIRLARGKERGCWYQVNFAHGRKEKLVNISKKEFFEGMPEYLSPREEPDLFAIATPETSITGKRKKLAALRDTTVHTDTAAKASGSSSTSGVSGKSSTRKERTGKRAREEDDVPLPPSKKKSKSGASTSSTSSHRNTTLSSARGNVEEPEGDGCLVCRRDDDHSNLLLCEGCETEIHTYCLDPPLNSVPDDDWFCGTTNNNKMLVMQIK